MIHDGVEEKFGYLLRFFSREFAIDLSLAMVPKMYPKNYLIQDGAHKKYKGLFLILKGSVNVILMREEGRQKNKLLCKLEEGSYFGDESIIEVTSQTTVNDALFHKKHNWAYTAKGQLGANALYVNSKKLEKLFYKYPVDAIKFLEISKTRLNLFYDYEASIKKRREEKQKASESQKIDILSEKEDIIGEIVQESVMEEEKKETVKEEMAYRNFNKKPTLLKRLFRSASTISWANEFFESQKEENVFISDQIYPILDITKETSEKEEESNGEELLNFRDEDVISEIMPLESFNPGNNKRENFLISAPGVLISSTNLAFERFQKIANDLSTNLVLTNLIMRTKMDSSVFKFIKKHMTSKKNNFLLLEIFNTKDKRRFSVSRSKSGCSLDKAEF